MNLSPVYSHLITRGTLLIIEILIVIGMNMYMYIL
jgi:hypothetical protein